MRDAVAAVTYCAVMFDMSIDWMVSCCCFLLCSLWRCYCTYSDITTSFGVTDWLGVFLWYGFPCMPLSLFDSLYCILDGSAYMLAAVTWCNAVSLCDLWSEFLCCKLASYAVTRCPTRSCGTIMLLCECNYLQRVWLAPPARW